MSRAPLLFLLLAGCETPLDTLTCEGTLDVSVFADADTPIGSDGITLTGTASHTGGLAIRSLLVGGVPATNGGGNYRNWTAALPLSQLRALDVDGDGALFVPVTARDSCGVIFDEPEATRLTLDPVPEVEVSRLTVTVSIPAGTTWLPADGVTPAVVTLGANPEAAGALVDLDASFGTLTGADNGVTLAGNGTADASASVLFSAADAGTAVLVATADGVAATATILVVEPPALSPPAATLLAGAAIHVEVWTDGAVETCAASGAASDSVAVTSADVSLYGGGAVTDTDGNGSPDFAVTVSPDAAAGASVELTCCDVFGQCASGTFTVAGG
jgi:hypothetical protein